MVDVSNAEIDRVYERVLNDNDEIDWYECVFLFI